MSAPTRSVDEPAYVQGGAQRGDELTNPQGYKSKTIATWVALIGGGVGLHRFYLHGFRDPWGWLFIWPSLVGVYGVQRMRHLGADDHAAWVLIPFLGVMLSIAMLTAIVYGLTPDDKWNARFNPIGPQHRAGWAAVIGVATALIVGAGVLMATLAFSAQRYFEYQAEVHQADIHQTEMRVRDEPAAQPSPLQPSSPQTNSIKPIQ